MKQLYAAAWLLVSMLFAIPGAAQAQSDTPVRVTIEKFFAAFNANNASAASDLWSADAVAINVNGMISGKARLDERIVTELRLGLKLGYTIDRIDVDGPIAWGAGQYTVTIPTKDGGSTQSNGAWLHILKRERGDWKLQGASFTRVNQPQKE